LSILSDVRIFLQALLPALDEPATHHERDLWVEGLNEEKARKEREYEKYDSLLTTRVRPQTVIREMQRVKPDDTLVVAETGYAFWWSALLLKVDTPKCYLSPSGNSTLGFGYPAALGAKCARPERSVICLVGDGGFLFSCQEIATAVEEKIPLVTIIFDDGGYAAIREYQSSGYDGRFIGVDFTNRPNFAKMAESMGAEGIIVTSEEAISSTIKEALGSKKSVVIDVKIGRDERVLPSFFTQVYRK
jgi:acetolactate synthase-1/2/3 large subunit